MMARMKFPANRLPALFCFGLLSSAYAAAVPVTIDPAQGFIRDGKPYHVKGAGGQNKLKELAALGANSIRTWSTTDLDKTMDEAQSHGLTVSAGIWLESECSWFSYHNPEHCAKQLERVKKEILRYREHPALLAWGLGNESEGGGDNESYWKQINRLAVMAKEADPAHPTFTAIAGMNAAKADGLNRHAPNLDYVGVNTYGGLFSLKKNLATLKWTRPWLVTEWGPQGFWERPKGAGGLPLEPTSTEKADMMAKAYDTALQPGGGSLGSYVFLWGWKNEGSVTWFGLLTDQDETTPSVDILTQRWSGQAPPNIAPAITPLTGVPAQEVASGTTFTANAAATDREGDPLTWRWAVLPLNHGQDNGVSPPMPAPVPDTITSAPGPKTTFRAPAKPGLYRVHVWVSDGQGHAATANAPLAVK